jgi:outer membrane protein assembly factor BamD (BamD/ComL family)
MNVLIRRNVAALFVLAAVLFTAACAGGGERIPAGLSPAELIQRAQEASDHNRYNLALQYYQTLLDRNPDNIDLVCTGEYEIAFIHYKQKKYALARNGFNKLLERYNTPDAELLPQQFKRLATIVLGSISEKEQRGILRSRKKQSGG